MADAQFAARAEEGMVRPLPLRRVTSALEEDTRASHSVSEHPRLCDEMRRARLYAWVLSRAHEIIADPEARAALAVQRTRAGELLDQARAATSAEAWPALARETRLAVEAVEPDRKSVV